MGCSLPGASIHGLLQARVLEWVAMLSSSGSSQPRDRTWVSCFAGRFFTNEPLGKPWPSKGPVILWGRLLHCQTPLARQGSLMWGSELSLLWENVSNNFSVWIAHVASMGFDFTMIAPLLPSRCVSVFGCRISFLVGSSMFCLCLFSFYLCFWDFHKKR